MNCKQGDVAIVVSAESGDDCAGVASRLCIGRVVRVVKLCDDGVWDFEETIDLGRITFLFEGIPASANVLIDGLHDRHLLPISGVPVHETIHDEVTA